MGVIQSRAGRDRIGLVGLTVATQTLLFPPVAFFSPPLQSLPLFTDEWLKCVLSLSPTHAYTHTCSHTCTHDWLFKGGRQLDLSIRDVLATQKVPQYDSFLVVSEGRGNSRLDESNPLDFPTSLPQTMSHEIMRGRCQSEGEILRPG